MRIQIECPHCGRIAATITQDAAPINTTVDEFVSRFCTTTPGATSTASELRGAYERWALANGEPPVSAKRFTMELLRISGVSVTRGTHGVRMYRGIALA